MYLMPTANCLLRRMIWLPPEKVRLARQPLPFVGWVAAGPDKKLSVFGHLNLRGLPMPKSSWLAFFILSSTIVPAFPAETHCPGSVAGVPLRHINRYQMLVPVSVNHSGPYDFLLDTGTQVTILDQSLAKSLNLKAEGLATLKGVGFQ